MENNWRPHDFSEKTPAAGCQTITKEEIKIKIKMQDFHFLLTRCSGEGFGYFYACGKKNK